MNQIKTIALLLVNIVLIAGLCACDELVTILSDNEKLDQLPQEIVVGIVFPMSGIYYQGPDDPVMNRFLNGFYMARDEINRKQLGSHQLRFILEDDRSTIDGAIEAYNKLINEDKVVAIIGPTSSSQVQMAFPVAQEKQLVAIGASSAAQGLSEIGNFVFRVNLTVDKLIPRGVQLTHDKLGYQRVAKLVTNDDAYSQSADAILTESLDAVGVEIVATETFDLRDSDLSEQLTRIKDLNPDAIFVAAQPLDQSKILVQGRDVGIPGEIPFIVPLLTNSVVEEAEDSAEGAITFTAWSRTANRPKNRAFVHNYREQYNDEPSFFTALAYTSVQILANAVSNARSTDSHAIRDALADTKDFDTVLGSFSFDDVGDALYNPIMMIVKNGELRVFQ